MPWIELSPDLSSDEPRHLTTRLNLLVVKFKVHNYAVMDLTNDDWEVETQQEVLNEHDDFVA